MFLFFRLVSWLTGEQFQYKLLIQILQVLQLRIKGLPLRERHFARDFRNRADAFSHRDLQLPEPGRMTLRVDFGLYQRVVCRSRLIAIIFHVLQRSRVISRIGHFPRGPDFRPAEVRERLRASHRIVRAVVVRSGLRQFFLHLFRERRVLLWWRGEVKRYAK